MIYAIEILDRKFVKIGYSGRDDYDFRIASLQTGNPFKINGIFFVPGTLLQEKAIHAALLVAFGRIRIPMPPNEWYPGNIQFFEAFLDNLKHGADFGLAYAEKYNPAIKQPGKKVIGSDCVPNIKWPRMSKRDVIY